MQWQKAMRRGICLGTMGAMFAFTSATMFAEPTQQPSYRTVTEAYDWGPEVSKVIMNLGHKVKQTDIQAKNFQVHVWRELAEGVNPPAQDTTQKPRVVLGAESTSDKDLAGERKVLRAYVSDAQGNPVAQGNYVVLEFAVAPNDTLGAAMNFDPHSYLNNWVKPHYTITTKHEVIDNNQGDIRPQADKFTYGTQMIEGRMSYPYASYEPKSAGKHPLIIWLHGMGEGGNTPSIPIMGNKAVAFADETIQKYFGGAYVLVPQARTYWMQGFQGLADGTSVYEDSLMKFIKSYVQAHPNIDSQRIYVGGDSNGGYMTMLLVRDNPQYFAAAFPTCEGLKDSLISAQDLQALSQTPIWFIAAKTDTTLPPKDYTVPTFERLKQAGADVHFSYFDKVIDTSGKYKQADGTAYEYPGHWSWIYVYNDECQDQENGKPVKLFKWMAEKVRE